MKLPALRPAHRLLGIALAGPLLAWSTTGLVFHVKPGWAEAYETLSAEQPGATIGPVELAAVLGAPASRVEVFGTALGLLARVTRGGAVSLVDVRTGQELPLLDEPSATVLAEDAVSRSPHRSAYGQALGAEVGPDAVVVRFAGEREVRVDRRSARLQRGGADTRRIDGLYRIHYLQWTDAEPFNRAFALAMIVVTWALTFLGLRMLVRRPGER